MIKRNTERAAGLSGHLLSLARRSPRAAALTNVNEIVADVVGLLRHTLSEEITLDVRVGDALLWTAVDPNQLEAALLSLAVNARDAMPSGGTLSIGTAETDELPALPSSGSGRAEHYIVISVAHSGAGADGEGLAPQAVRSVLEQSGAVLTSEPRDHGGMAKLHLPRHAG
jgi:signal transduction histidine kinase